MSANSTGRLIIILSVQDIYHSSCTGNINKILLTTYHKLVEQHDNILLSTIQIIMAQATKRMMIIKFQIWYIE